jgi:hypothetical protein
LELQNDVFETLTATWAAGDEVNVMVASGVGGAVRWVDPLEIATSTDYAFSTRSSQKTYWYDNQLPHLPRFKVEADSGYQLTSIQYQGIELLGSTIDARYRSGQANEPAYQCVGNNPSACFFTLAITNARSSAGDLVFTFREKFNYTFTFDGGGGVLNPDSETVRTGFAAQATLPVGLFTREGYTFVNWQDSIGQGYRADNLIEITRNYTETFTANWQIQSYQLIFAGIENASVTSNSNHIGAYEYGSSDTFTLTPNAGFCTNAAPVVIGSAGLVATNYNVNGTFTLTNITGALTVTFDIHPCAYQFTIGRFANVGGGTGTSVSIGTDRYFNIPDAPSAPSGARFLNWATSANGSGETYTAGELIDLSSESFTASSLYGQWELSIVINNLEMNSDDASTPGITTNLDSFIQSKTCDFLENGASLAPYSQNNWPLGNFPIRCTGFTLIPGARLDPAFTIVDGILNIHVHRYNYSITFNTGDAGTTVAPRSGSTHQISLPNSAGDYADHTFMGWAASPGGAVIPNGIVFLSADYLNVTLYAIWQPNLSEA